MKDLSEYTAVAYRVHEDGSFEVLDPTGGVHGPFPADQLVRVLREIYEDPNKPSVKVEPTSSTDELVRDATKTAEGYLRERSPFAYHMVRVLGENWPAIRSRLEHIATRVTPEYVKSDDVAYERYRRRHAR